MFIFTVRGNEGAPYRVFFDSRDALENSAEYLNKEEFLVEDGERIDILEMTDSGVHLLQSFTADM